MIAETGVVSFGHHNPHDPIKSGKVMRIIWLYLLPTIFNIYLLNCIHAKQSWLLFGMWSVFWLQNAIWKASL